MISELNSKCVNTSAALVVQFILLSPAFAEEVTVDAKLLDDLQQVIKNQQRQIENQARVLESLQSQLNQLKADTAEAKTEAKKATAAVAAAPAAAPEVVTSGQERVKLSISGQVNRATNVASDGKSTKVYFVDNDASNSRVRFVGTAQLNDELSVGTRIEVAIAPNESSEVSQDNEDSGDFFDERWADLSATHKRYGTLYLGKGSTASDNSAEQDLSGTDVVQYASIADIMGGLQFRNSNKNLTGISVSDGFKDFDGLSRQSRVRYDSPTIGGATLQASYVTNQRWDSAIFWGGKSDTLTAVAAAAVAEPNEENIDLQYDGSFSMLHTPSGLNLTLSAGMKDSSDGGNPSNLYGKIGYFAKFSDIGATAFGLDYTRSNNLPDGSFDGNSVSGAVVQHLENYGTEIYAQFRRYNLNSNDGPNLKAINGGTLGARVKF